MCYKCENPEMAGLHAGHLPSLSKAAPNMADVTASLHSALTNNLNPHLPVLPAFMAMIESVLSADYGVLGEHRLVRLPLSIIGVDKVRYRTQIVEWLHESILSMRMSDKTIEAVRTVLRPHDLCLMFMCSCGVVMGRCSDVRAYYRSDESRKMDLLRSAIDAGGNPVKTVSSFDEIKVPTMDLHINGSEERLFARISQLTQIASVTGHAQYDWVDDELARFAQLAQPMSIAA